MGDVVDARGVFSQPRGLGWLLALLLVDCRPKAPEAPPYPCGEELIVLQAERASERRAIIDSGACRGMLTVTECPALRQLYERWAKVLDRWEECSSKP